ncbi:putative tRNA (guanine(26)-N(2))-dimethyltransferase 1 [Hypsibius exemplaris]|uniref:tRNA (guanine(26)-N(2))-dimethyltransferase n=1 Tax=Hypsibius exemplaris TaxID=2072580 RepID=A0A1W0WCJ2_HYPEX|nr:putative tRNA (guanine(26)-N(2))-dimethyltransferase 1 [Hypsibius exemplaris]
MIHEELPDQPLYFCARDIFKVVHCTPIPAKQLISALRRAGYKCSGSHCEQESYKTDASFDVIWDIIRCWIKRHPISEQRATYPKTSVILGKEPSFQADFAVLPEVETESRVAKHLRFPKYDHSGPMARPKQPPNRDRSVDQSESGDGTKRPRL